MLNAVALGNGRFRCGRLELLSSYAQCDRFTSGQRVRLYLRPEDRFAEGDLNGAANRIGALVKRVEFLGAQCLAEVQVAELEGQPVQLFFSLNQMYDLGIREGARLDLALRADRLRAFDVQ
jgi:iron(III) transport system ATP-binding protein